MRTAAILATAGALLLAGCATRVEPIHMTGDPFPVTTQGGSDPGETRTGEPEPAKRGLEGETAPNYSDGTPMELSEKTPAKPEDQTRSHELIGGVAKLRGAQEAMRVLGVWREADPIAKANCHFPAHLIGRWAARTAKDNLAEIKQLLTLERGWCEGGFMHGVAQQYSLLVSDEQLRKATPGFCDSVAGRGGGTKASCYHGLGHGFALRWPDSVRTAFSACTMLEEAADRSRCYGGVAMEFRNNYMAQSGLEQFHMNGTMGFDKPVRVKLTEEDTENLCVWIEADAPIGYECYMELTWFWVGATKDPTPDFADLERRCRLLPELGREPCARGAGYFAVDMRVNLNDAPEQRAEAADEILQRSCAKLSEDLEEACVMGYTYRLFSGYRIELDDSFCKGFSGVRRRGCEVGLEAARRSYEEF